MAKSLHLPAELLLKILQCLREGLPGRDVMLRTYAGSLAHCALVCQHWNSIVIPLLYGSVSIDTLHANKIKLIQSTLLAKFSLAQTIRSLDLMATFETFFIAPAAHTKLIRLCCNFPT